MLSESLFSAGFGILSGPNALILVYQSYYVVELSRRGFQN